MCYKDSTNLGINPWKIIYAKFVLYRPNFWKTSNFRMFGTKNMELDRPAQRIISRPKIDENDPMNMYFKLKQKTSSAQGTAIPLLSLTILV